MKHDRTEGISSRDLDCAYPRDIVEIDVAWPMPILKKRTHKHFQLDPRKIKHAQRVLKAKTETIERALDLAIAQYPKSCLIAEANERFVGPQFANR